MVYDFHTGPNSQTLTPQTEVIPGREQEMVKGKSGAVAFDAGVWEILRRCLIMGTASGSYYSNKQELTNDFVEAINNAIAINPQKAAEEILYASDGHAINNHAPIFALVALSIADNQEAKSHFKRIFPKVIRTLSHFYEWINYTKSMRGMGRLITSSGKAWLQRENVKWLAYQFLKYQKRYDFSGSDILKLFRPKPTYRGAAALFSYVTGKDVIISNSSDPELEQVRWVEWTKQNPHLAARAIREGKLTHEMVTGFVNMNREVWQALFEKMPVGALLRNIGSLTEIGVLGFNTTTNNNLVSDTLLNKELLEKARIHPIDILKALKVYQSGGKSGKSKKTWTPVPHICDILEDCLNLSFDIPDPTGKKILHAVDISGSMSFKTVSSIDLKCCEIAAAMALTTARCEDNYIIRGFFHDFIDLGITARDTYMSAIQKSVSKNFGATDASVAYQWAIANQVEVDVFVFWTDSESWKGSMHPTQALQLYREKINPKARAIYVTLVPNSLSLGDPEDMNSFNIAGFDPSAPKLISAIANGEI